MESSQTLIRPLRSWIPDTTDIQARQITFERTIYDQNKNSKSKIKERLDFSSTEIPDFIRLSIIACICLGKISPSHAQNIIDESKYVLESTLSPISLHEFLSKIDSKFSAIMDDSMQGVLTRPFHENLFSEKTLLNALEFVHETQVDKFKEIIELYFKTYTKCRQHIMDMALSMVHHISSLTHEEIYPGEEFYSWWRGRCQQEIQIQISDDQFIILLMPNIPVHTAERIASIIQEIANSYGKLARLLGRPDTAIMAFIQAFGVELMEGMVNLPLNQLGGKQCPTAKDMEIYIKNSNGFPTNSSNVKEVRIKGQVFADSFNRFFAVKDKYFLLPRTQRQIIIHQLGGCPFPDYGFLDAQTEKLLHKHRNE